MFIEILEKYPILKNQFESLYENRRNEILNQMMESDSEYIKLSSERANASKALRAVLDDKTAELFEKYSDSLHVHEIHEIDAVYKQAVCDALTILQRNGLI